jgi:hypothetical protein
MADKRAIQRSKGLDEERAKLFDQANEEALQKGTQVVADLNALGLNSIAARGGTENKTRHLGKRRLERAAVKLIADI